MDFIIENRKTPVMKKVDVIVVGDARIHTYLIGHRAIHENRK
jgi:hypothetical protein